MQILRALLVLSVACLASAASAAVPQWRVTEVAGIVQVVDARGSRPARAGTFLAPGAALVTGPRARAVVTRGREYAVIAPRSRFRLPDAKASRGLTQWFADTGSALFKIEKKETPHFGVGSRYLAAVVKGTTFRVTVTATGAAVGVVEGRVAVGPTRGGARPATVGAGRAALVSADAPGAVTLGRYSPEAGRDDARDLQRLHALEGVRAEAARPVAETPVAAASFAGPSPWAVAIAVLAASAALLALAFRRRAAPAGGGAATSRWRDLAAAESAPTARTIETRAIPVAGPPAGAAPVEEHAPDDALSAEGPADDMSDDDPRRGAPRSRVLLAATLDADGISHAVRLRDLSQTGAVVEGVTPPAVGAHVRIEAERFARRAEVLWAREGRFGMRFDEPLDEAALPRRGGR